VAASETTTRQETPELPVPFYWSGDHLLVELPGARAVFTTRRGGFSQGPFATLNLGRLTADDPAAVGRNRALLQSLVGGRLAMIRQVHGSRVMHRTAAEQASGPAPAGQLDEADGQATALPRIAPIVLTADCLPIALAGGGVVAMLHAGWRGLDAGIIERGARAVRELAGDEPVLTAAIGPGAGSCCYEVGEEVHRRFASHRDARCGDNLDLKAIARQRLQAAGVLTVHDVGLCTICSPRALFFSHRRDRGVTGRQAGVVWLT
jgi:polyphenol oxidase